MTVSAAGFTRPALNAPHLAEQHVGVGLLALLLGLVLPVRLQGLLTITSEMLAN